VISSLLDKTVSFIRVMPWEYVTKKGGAEPVAVVVPMLKW
jgi:hypothetical protein